MPNNPFTDDEDALILLLFEHDGADYPEIADYLGRPNGEVIRRRYAILGDRLNIENLPDGLGGRARYRILAERLDATQRASTSRCCLRCRDPFLSSGLENRICDPCASANSKIWTFGGVVHEVATAVRRGVDAPVSTSVCPFLRPRVAA